ncbi:MAG: hypothetical protein AAFV45_12725 [Pseudomonadota bacterium]
MTLSQSSLVIGSTVFALTGLFLFKDYAVSRNTLSLVAGFCAYGLSNVLFIMLLSDVGLTVALTLASAAQIVLTVIVARLYFGESATPGQLLGAVLACAAVTATLWGGGRQSSSPANPADDRTITAEQTKDSTPDIRGKT